MGIINYWVKCFLVFGLFFFEISVVSMEYDGNNLVVDNYLEELLYLRWKGLKWNVKLNFYYIISKMYGILGFRKFKVGVEL